MIHRNMLSWICYFLVETWLIVMCYSDCMGLLSPWFPINLNRKGFTQNNLLVQSLDSSYLLIIIMMIITKVMVIKMIIHCDHGYHHDHTLWSWSSSWSYIVIMVIVMIIHCDHDHRHDHTLWSWSSSWSCIVITIIKRSFTLRVLLMHYSKTKSI